MVIIFSGIPGCGKTTIAKKLASSLRAQRGNPSVKLFISDNLKPPVYKKFFRLLKGNLSAEASAKADYLIFDATFYKKAWRDKMRKIAKGHNVLTVYLKCPLPIAIQRNKKRHAGIPEKALHIMASKFEEPKHPDITIDTKKTPVSESVKKILGMLNENI